jgi:hypothetical protein
MRHDIQDSADRVKFFFKIRSVFYRMQGKLLKRHEQLHNLLWVWTGTAHMLHIQKYVTHSVTCDGSLTNFKT